MKRLNKVLFLCFSATGLLMRADDEKYQAYMKELKNFNDTFTEFENCVFNFRTIIQEAVINYYNNSTSDEVRKKITSEFSDALEKKHAHFIALTNDLMRKKELLDKQDAIELFNKRIQETDNWEAESIIRELAGLNRTHELWEAPFQVARKLIKNMEKYADEQPGNNEGGRFNQFMCWLAGSAVYDVVQTHGEEFTFWWAATPMDNTNTLADGGPNSTGAKWIFTKPKSSNSSSANNLPKAPTSTRQGVDGTTDGNTIFDGPPCPENKPYCNWRFLREKLNN